LRRPLPFILVLILLVIIAGAAFAVYRSLNVDAPLSGISVSRQIADRRPIAVMIDNFAPDARPQSGLAQADLVFETLTEGGITRFMAVFQSQDASMIGPVRSTRYYYNSWAAALGVIFGHDGGNVDALHELPSLTTIYNEDADRITGPFYRISSRAVPHNEYTSTTRLRDYAAAHQGATTGVRMSLPHKNDSPSGAARSFLHIDFSYGDYNVTWEYNPAGNDYLRYMGGAPHVDAQTRKQLTAKNVVVMYTQEQPFPDPYTPGSIRLTTIGSGKATVYQDGRTIQGTWQQSSVNGPLRWLDSSGSQIPLNRGATWVEVVPNNTPVSVSASP